LFSSVNELPTAIFSLDVTAEYGEHLFTVSAELTKRQHAVLRILERRTALGEPAPTFREIGSEIGTPNVSAVAKHVDALRRKGMLISESGRSRSLRIVSPLRNMQMPVAHIPLFGSIPAGYAENREQSAEECISVDVETLGFKPGRNTFALRVSGDSMVGRHIVSGDIVILDPCPEPRHGDIVAALIDGESTLKTFLHKNGRPFLKAENSKYPNFIPAEELMIQGVFKALIRNGRQ
jgi:repressor LexA